MVRLLVNLCRTNLIFEMNLVSQQLAINTIYLAIYLIRLEFILG